MFVLALTAVLAVVSGLARGQDCDSGQSDICGTQIWPYLVDPTTTPGTEEQLAQTCVKLKEGEKCVKDFIARCPLLKKEVADSVVDALSYTVTDFCTGNLGKRFLPHGTCLAQNLAKNFTCNTDGIAEMEAINSLPIAPVEKLRLTCCAYLELDQCFTSSVTAACDRRASRALRNVLQSYAIFMVDRCLPFLSEPDKCDLSQIKGLKSASGRRPKTFLPALFDVAVVAF